MIISPLFKHEIVNHFKVYNTAFYFLLFLLFTLISMVFVIPPSQLTQLGPSLLLIIIVIAQISNSSALFQADFKDGTLEFILTVKSADNIALTKFFALNFVSLLMIIITLPIFFLLYAVDIRQTLKLLVIYSLMLNYINSFVLLISAIQIYFGAACNFIALLIFPLVIPGIICGVLSIMDASILSQYLKLILGLNFLLTPVILIMVAYLIRNVYEI